jgi:ribosomal-protein-alanine N-acetyltransferase
MRIRSYRPTDLQVLYQIDHACFPPGIAYPKHELMHFIAMHGARTWVAESGDDTVGFLIACPESQGAIHIVTIDVVASSRRQGVGRALMDAAEMWAGAQKANAIYLETAEDNLIAQRFYEARGYFRVEKVEGYYSNGQAAWVMAKDLKDEL